MRLTVNIEKKHLLVFIALISIAFIGLVIAQSATIHPWDNSQHLAWHSADDIKINISGGYYSLQDAFNNGLIASQTQINNLQTQITNINNNGGSGGVLQTFTTSAGSDSTYSLTCTGCPADHIMAGGVSCCTGFIGPLGGCNFGQVVPFDKVKYATDKTGIKLNSNIVIGSGKYYEFACTYGDASGTGQSHVIELNNTEQIIARFSEPQLISRVGYYIGGTYPEKWGNPEDYAYSAYVNSSGSMIINVKKVTSCTTANAPGPSRTVCGNVPVYSTGGGYMRDEYRCWTVAGDNIPVTTCGLSSDCPAYKPTDPSFFSDQSVYYSWKGLRCNIKQA